MSQPNDAPIDIKEMPPINTLGSLASFLLGGAFYTVTLRMQCQPELQKLKRNHVVAKNPFEAAGNLLKNEGFLALWKGSFARILQGVARTSLMIGAVSVGVSYFGASGMSNWTAALLNLAVLGLCYPLKFAEIVLTNNYQPGFKTIRSVLRQGVNKGGPASLFRGFWTYYLKIGMLTPASYYFFGELSKRLDNHPATQTIMRVSFFSVEAIKYALTTVWARTALRSAIGNPYSNAWECTKAIIAEGGIKPFYHGFSAYLFFMLFIGGFAKAEFTMGH